MRTAMNRLLSPNLIRLLSLLLLLSSPLTSLAQEALYSISGRVQDEQKEALLGASVSLLLADGKLKTGVITNKDGAFLLKGVRTIPFASPSSAIRATPPPYSSDRNP